MIKSASPPRTDIEPTDVAVGARIRFYRKHRGLSQSFVGDKLGVSFQQIQKYERGTTRVSASMIVKMADALGVSISALFGELDPPAEQSELFHYLTTPGAPALLECYAKMSPLARQGVLALSRSLAEERARTSGQDAGRSPEL